MRLGPLLLVTFVLAGCGTPTRPESPITAQTLSTHPVIGTLGVPLGTVVDIRATVVRGSDIGPKEFTSDYLLRVTEVNGHLLQNPPTLRFDNAPGFGSRELGNDCFALYKAKTGKDAGTLTGEQIAQLEKGYVGKQFHLLVYERGRFAGVPANLPGGEVWQGPGFGFSTSVSILAERP